MAFGFFSGKDDFADIIYTGGTIHTMDDSMPLADAVACKGGMILRVGTDEDMRDIIGDDTEIFDLEGMHMFPGFIETDAAPVLDAIDEDVCFVINERENIDEILAELAEYINDHFNDTTDDTEEALFRSFGHTDGGGMFGSHETNEDELFGNEEYFEIPDVIFGYGFDAEILKDMELIERQHLLDEICDGTPILLLSEDGLTGWFNTAAFDIASAAAEESGTEILTLPFMLSALAPVDPMKFESSSFEVLQGYCREGFTTVFEGSAGSYLTGVFEELQMNLITESNAKLRFINGIYICSEVNSQYIDMQLKNHKTNYQELNGMIMGGIVSAHIHDGNLSGEYLTDMMKTAASRGATVMLDAESPEDTDLCRSAIRAFREKAGGKTEIMLSHDGILMESDTHFEYELLPAAGTVEDKIRIRTVLAAEKLGLSHLLGSVSEEKYADFTVFEDDPLLKPLIRGEMPDADMTVIAGEIVYDAADDNSSIWSMMTSSQVL